MFWSPKWRTANEKLCCVAGDGAGDVRAAQRQAAAAGGVDVVGDAADVIAEQLGLFGKRGEDGADGVVRGHLLEVQLHGVDALLVDVGAVAGLGLVGVGLGQAGEKCGLERRGLLAEELPRKLQHARGVGDDLHGLDAGRYRRRTSRNWCT